MSKITTYLAIILIFISPAMADCTLPNSVIPPDLSYGGIVMMDGYEWSLDETTSGNRVTRRMARISFDYPESDAYMTSAQAENIARSFFERNERILGVPQSIEVETEDLSHLPVSVGFVSSERQECEGMEVIGTVSGTLDIGGGDEFQVASLTITWYSQVNLEDTTPAISAEQALAAAGGEGAAGGGAGGGPKLAILPTGEDDFKLVWEIKDDQGNSKIIDAETGKEISEEEEKNKKMDTKIIILAIAAILVAAVGYFIIQKKK